MEFIPQRSCSFVFCTSNRHFFNFKKNRNIFLSICFFYYLLPKNLFGLHYPTDILAGAIIGIFITLVLSSDRISRSFLKIIFKFSDKFPGLFYALFFILSFEIGSMFNTSQSILAFIKALIHLT